MSVGKESVPHYEGDMIPSVRTDKQKVKSSSYLNMKIIHKLQELTLLTIKKKTWKILIGVIYYGCLKMIVGVTCTVQIFK